MNEFDAIAQKCKTTEEALFELKKFGATPIEAIKALRQGRGLSLRESKSELMLSVAWKDEATAANSLHEQIEKLFDEYDDK